ncbi:MAG: hypothetical protein IT431_15530 [Phycisphaerales bacterium]|nr:hypothetical protein [Phycisphaerales bacterium]
MQDSLVERYARRNPPLDPPAPEPEVTEADMGCFGWLRGVRERALMLELRKKDGHILALGYAWIERIEYQPERGITLHSPGRRVLLQGSGLNREVRPLVSLFGGLLRHRVPWVREDDRAGLLMSGETVVAVERIDWGE